MLKAVEKVLELVRKQTGYPVTVTNMPGIKMHSTLRTASAVSPAHVILLNPAYERSGNYLTALNAATILVKWADPQRVPDFYQAGEAVEAAVKTLSGDERLRGEGMADARTCAETLCHLLLQHLSSLPVVMIAADWCYRNFPELEEEQRVQVRQELREASACLTKEVRERTPEFIFSKSAVMNAAYAAWWAALAEDTQALLPYEFFGFKEDGMRLYGKTLGGFTDNPNRYCEVIDSWAEELGLRTWYTWQFRQG